MTDKEKLIGLFQTAPIDIMGNHPVGSLADWLIVNGVIIPVRCKDCAYSDPKSPKSCPLYRKGLMKDADYCSVGERKNNGN